MADEKPPAPLSEKQILAEHARFKRSGDRLYKDCWNSKVLPAEWAKVKDQPGSEIYGSNPTTKVFKILEEIEKILEKIFIRHAGEAAVRENEWRSR